MKDRLLLAAAFLAAFTVSAASAAPLRLEKGDHVAIIGNALGERMQHHGWLEALIHARYPDHELVFRNLAFPGDELELRLRSENFGSPDEHLTRVAADVVFAFFGYNESFAGPDGVEEFQKRLERLVDHTLGQKYNGKSAPRLVLFSPIAHENLHDPHLPDGTANNESLRRYTAAMADVARRKSVVFVDLFAPSLEAYAKADSPLTIDGVHLSERGDRIFAPAIEKALFAVEPDPARDSARLEKIRAAVLDKNFHWFERYRTVDGYSIFGGRAGLSFVDGQTNRVVAQREMEVLDVMSANRDRAIWAAAQGKRFAVDDSNTPPFLPVKSNLPGTGPGGTHTFLGAQEAIASMTVHKGMKVNLFASEEKFPELANPVQMAFDPRGRLWVAVMPSYPHWKPKERMDDKVLILEDTDGDGSADRVKVFADHLHVPTGLELWGGGLFVGQMPDLVFLKDTNGDDVADERERVLNGLDSADTHHAMNSFVLDPGGALYFQEGTFHHTQVESIYGPPVRCANAGVFRYEPRTHRFEVYVTYPFANPHGHVFDHWGQDFVTDGTGSVNYYAAAFSGRLDYPDKHRELDPFFQQRIRPCPGTEILSSRHFPDELQGNYLIANVIGFLGILQYEVRDEGAGFKGSEVEPIVQSSDSNFRPSDLEIGPDGALYFLDWQNPIIGHMQHNLRDPNRDRTHGRIYRVSCEGRPLLRPAVIAGAPVASLLNLLKEPEDRVRHRVRIELSSRPASEVLPAAKTWIASLDRDDPSYEHHLLEALWLHQSQDAVDRELLVRLLRSEDFRARAAATRVLCYWRDRIPDALALLAVQADDNYARVRLEAVRAASFFDESRAVDVALTAVKHPLDYYLKYTLGETLRQLEPYWKKAIREGATVAAGNPAGVDFMLAKVSTAELVKLPRSPLVYQAILSRDNVVHESRHEALEGLAKAHGSSVLNELLVAVERLDAQGGDSSERVLHDLAHLLVTSPSSELKAQRARLWKLAVEGRSPVTRQIAFVAVVAADGSPEKAFHEATSAFGTLRDILDAVPLIADAKARAAAHELILPLISALPPELQEAGKASKGTQGRYVRIELPRRGTLTLAEVQVFSGGANVATTGAAKQSSVSNGGVASRAIDGNTSGRYSDGGQTHSREGQENPWWELDLGKELPIEAVTVWNRTEGKGQFVSRLEGFTLRVLDASRGEAFVKAGIPAPPESARIDLPAGGADAIRRSAMSALAATGKDDAGNFRLLAKLLREGKDRDGAIRALSRVPRAGWPKEDLPPLIDALLEHIAALAPEDRTQPAARDAFQLGGRCGIPPRAERGAGCTQAPPRAGRAHFRHPPRGAAHGVRPLEDFRRGGQARGDRLRERGHHAAQPHHHAPARARESWARGGEDGCRPRRVREELRARPARGAARHEAAPAPADFPPELHGPLGARRVPLRLHFPGPLAAHVRRHGGREKPRRRAAGGTRVGRRGGAERTDPSLRAVVDDGGSRPPARARRPRPKCRRREGAFRRPLVQPLPPHERRGGPSRPGPRAGEAEAERPESDARGCAPRDHRAVESRRREVPRADARPHRRTAGHRDRRGGIGPGSPHARESARWQGGHGDRDPERADPGARPVGSLPNAHGSAEHAERRGGPRPSRLRIRGRRLTRLPRGNAGECPAVLRELLLRNITTKEIHHALLETFRCRGVRLHARSRFRGPDRLHGGFGERRPGLEKRPSPAAQVEMARERRRPAAADPRQARGAAGRPASRRDRPFRRQGSLPLAQIGEGRARGVGRRGRSDGDEQQRQHLHGREVRRRPAPPRVARADAGAGQLARSRQ
jgi:glucose/arabinose dehydrogenase